MSAVAYLTPKIDAMRTDTAEIVSEPRTRAILLRLLEDFEDKLFGAERRGDLKKREGGAV